MTDENITPESEVADETVADDTPAAPLTSDQLVTHLVTWLMKGLHA